MIVSNIEQAWMEAEKFIPVYMKDYEASKNAGYDIFVNLEKKHEYICDLGCRLELNLANGKSTCIWIEQPSNIEEYAKLESATVTIRTYANGGSSNDFIRNTTESEGKILYTILYGALTAIVHGKKDKQTTMDVAEYIGLNAIENMNSYDSIYCKIRSCPFLKEEE